MKTKFQQYKSLALISLLSFGAASLLTASAAEAGGKDILHLNLSTSITNDTVALGEVGQVRLKFHQQGSSTVQSLDLNVSSLDGDATYALLAKVGDSELTEVDQFTTDADGAAKVRYMKVDNVNGKVYKPGKGRFLLPEGLSHLSQLRQLAIQKVADVLDGVSVLEGPVMRAELEYPDHLSYLVKRDISMSEIPASLRIQANDQRGQIRLTAANLIPSTHYWLVLNGPVANGGAEYVFSTDDKGKLAIRFALDNPLHVLALRKVQVRDLSEVGLSEPDLSASLVLEVSLP